MKNALKQRKCASITSESPQEGSMVDKSDYSLTEYAARLFAYSNSIVESYSPEKSAMAPLLERVERLIQKMPSEELKKGISLSDLQLRLKGRKGKSCHPGELADCLRKLNFRRVRSWNQADDGFRSKWFKKT